MSNPLHLTENPGPRNTKMSGLQARTPQRPASSSRDATCTALEDIVEIMLRSCNAHPTDDVCHDQIFDTNRSF